MKIDVFKKRTLEKMAKTRSDSPVYPINKADLIKVNKCPVCGSTKSASLTEVYLKSKLNFFNTAACLNCPHVYRTISPTFRWFQKCWKVIAEPQPKIFNPEFEKIRKQRYEKYYQLLKKYTPSYTRVLDIGAAFGTGSLALKKSGAIVDCIETEDNKANYIKQNLNLTVHTDTIENLKTKNRYDLIIFAHCLEHLDDPRKALSNIKQLLKPDGVLYVEIPVLWNYVTWSDALYLTHKNNFTENGLVKLVNEFGFSVLKKVKFRNTPKEPWDQGFVLKLSDKPAKVALTKMNDTSLTRVQKLYRKQFPIKELPTINKPVKYQIDHIEQFYCTVLLNKRQMNKDSRNTYTFSEL